MRWLIRALTVLVVLCLVVLGGLVYEMAEQRPGAVAPALADDGTPAASLGQFTPLAAPRPAPALHFATRDGMPKSLGDFRGKPVLINLWATWCAPCVKEMPSLQRLQAARGSRLQILAISQDRGGGPTVDAFLAKLRLNALPIYLDPTNEAMQAFAVQALPTSILLDEEGRILGQLQGDADWDSPAMLALLDRYLAPGDKAATR